MKFLQFTKIERNFLIITFALVFVFTSVNLIVAKRKSRDVQRKADIRRISNAIEQYKSDFGFLPDSADGQIVACEPVTTDSYGVVSFSPCQWAFDSLQDLSDPDYPPYLDKIPSDPHHGRGVRYLYVASNKNFQVFASLEGRSEAEYDPAIEARGLSCGNRICNFGLSPTVPLDKSIQEYENELGDD
jgi:hypothetical protein